jgi:hypothetical protein
MKLNLSSTLKVKKQQLWQDVNSGKFKVIGENGIGKNV